MTRVPSRHAAPSDETGRVRAALERVLGSPTFASTQALRSLLRFLVDEKLAGREDRLKEYTLGVEAFGRGDAFDPKADTIVRVQARRLRAKLDEYYRGSGSSDSLRIAVPKGAYVPEFHSVGTWPETPYQPDTHAHALYVEGRRLSNLGTTKGLLLAVGQFRAAVDVDPRYAFPYWALADAYLQLSSTHLPPREAMPRAREAALVAIALDPSLDQAHAALGTVHLRYDWDREAALGRAMEAVRLNPHSCDAHFLCGYAASTEGRTSQALIHFRRAQELDPFSLKVRFQTQAAYLLARDYEAAIEEGLRTLRIEPGFALGRAALGLAYSLFGDHLAGLDHLHAAFGLDDGPWQTLFLQHGYAFAGDRRKAQQLVWRLEKLAEERYICAYEIGEAHAVMENEDSAFDWLERALEERSDCLVWLEVEPWMDGIREAGRYPDFVARLRTEKANPHDEIIADNGLPVHSPSSRTP